MGSERCSPWRRRETEQFAQRSAATGTPNWSSALVEELQETNVIAHHSMVVLKELGRAPVDPALLSDLRHDKDIRSSLYPENSHAPHSMVMMEAKRILKREENAKRHSSLQNKIVDTEVDRFQNHITSLRKMNQRLERIAFPSPKRKLGKMHHGPHFSVYHLPKGESLNKLDSMQDHCRASPEQEKFRRKYQDQTGHISTNDPENFNHHTKSQSNLSISGSKMDEHEILKHNPTLSSQIPSESQSTVFEKIHQKYIESERNRVLNEGTIHIRHTSPINDHSQGVKHPAVSSLRALPSKDNSKVHLGKWAEDVSVKDASQLPVVHKSDVSISEWSPSTKSSKEVQASRRTKNMEQCPMESDTLPPTIVSRREEQNKLESMSKMYAKWMKKVCVSPKTKSDDFSLCKGKLERAKEGSSSQQSNMNGMTREEKIMQVLQALQKHKEEKASDVAERRSANSSRFSKSVNDVREEKPQTNFKYRRAISGTYEHRLRAHKELITHQKSKLEEQKKEIEDLKLSQLRIENEKSQMLTQKALNEVLVNCNEKVKGQAKSLKASLSLADLSPGNDFVLRMEKRALEQRQKKLLAQERRKQFEEERKRKLIESEEKKRLEEEMLLKKKHDEALEMRRKEREMREEARKERERAIALERKADLFCQNKRLKKGLLGFKKFLVFRKKQEEFAIDHYDKYLLQHALRAWKSSVESNLKAKMEHADQFYSSKLLQRCFNALKTEMNETTKYMQVAVDMHDFHLQEQYFHLWLKFTHEQKEIEAEKMAKAKDHFSKELLHKCLIKWQKYPRLAQLEREKERRKMMWRNKVQQLLPDFRPILSSD